MKIMGTILVLFSAYKILSPGIKLTFSRLWALPTGFISGILGGAFGTEGPPVVVYAALRPWAKSQVVGMMQSFFIFANFIVLCSFGYHGLLTRSVFDVALLAIPMAIAGIFTGLWINRSMGQHRFEKVLSVVIGLMGVVLFLR